MVKREKYVPPTYEQLASKLFRLTNFMMTEIPGEPGDGEDVVDYAIRTMISQRDALEDDDE